MRTAAVRNSAWVAFQTAFLAQFAPVSNVRHARDRLSTLYHDQVRRTVYHRVPEPGPADPQHVSVDEQLDRFVRGLKHSVRREVEMREPADLETAMRLADRADTLMYRDSASVSRPAAPPTGPVPMDIGAVAGTYSAPLPKLTPQERLRLKNDDRCFRCRQKGHSSCKLSTGKLSALAGSGNTVSAAQRSQEPTKGIARASMRTPVPVSRSSGGQQAPLQPRKVEGANQLGQAKDHLQSGDLKTQGVA